MLGLTADDTDPLARRKRDRRTFGGLVAAAILAFISLDYLGRPLLAVAAYWLLVLAAAGVVTASNYVMDERDRALERRASHRAVLTVGAGLIALGPGLGALADANVYNAPPVLDGVVLGWGILYVVWGVAYLWERQQV